MNAANQSVLDESVPNFMTQFTDCQTELDEAVSMLLPTSTPLCLPVHQHLSGREQSASLRVQCLLREARGRIIPSSPKSNAPAPDVEFARIRARTRLSSSPARPRKACLACNRARAIRFSGDDDDDDDERQQALSDTLVRSNTNTQDNNRKDCTQTPKALKCRFQLRCGRAHPNQQRAFHA